MFLCKQLLKAYYFYSLMQTGIKVALSQSSRKAIKSVSIFGVIQCLTSFTNRYQEMLLDVMSAIAKIK